MTTLLKERNITTKLLIDDLDMWDEFDIKKNQDPQVDEYYKTIMELINQQIQNGVNWLDSDIARNYFYNEAKYQQEVFQSLENEWDTLLNNSYTNIEELLKKIYHTGKQKGYHDIHSRIKYTETDKQALKIARNYNYHLIQKIDNDTRNQIKNIITKAAIAGEHPTKIAPQILNVAETQLKDSIFTPKQRATMIARTETSRVQNTGILQTYINEGYTEVKILTAEDDNVCYTCLRYAFEFNDEDHVTFENRGKERVHNIIKLVEGDSFPPFHPNCRCTYLSVWKSKGKPPKNPLIVDLTLNSSVKFLQDFQDISDTFDVVPYVQLTEDKIPNIFSNKIKQRFLEFDKKIKNAEWEYTYISNLTTDKVGEICTDKKRRKVKLRRDIPINEGDESLVTHSHTGHMPFNPDDIKVIFNNPSLNVKYIVVHTPTDVFIGKFKKNSMHNAKTVLTEISKGYGEAIIRRGVEDYITAGQVWENYKNNKELNKYMSFRRIRK